MKLDVWKKKKTRQLADCRVFSVREDISESQNTGKSASFYVVENPDWVNIIPVTNSGQVVLIEQFRHGIERVTLEIPGGMIDKGEAPDACARRELKEETGYTAGKIVSLGRSHPNPAIQNNWIYHFAALDCEKTDVQAFDEHESISIRLAGLDDIGDLIETGEITHSLVITGFHRFDAYNRRQPGHIYES